MNETSETFEIVKDLSKHQLLTFKYVTYFDLSTRLNELLVELGEAYSVYKGVSDMDSSTYDSDEATKLDKTWYLPAISSIHRMLGEHTNYIPRIELIRSYFEQLWLGKMPYSAELIRFFIKQLNQHVSMLTGIVYVYFKHPSNDVKVNGDMCVRSVNRYSESNGKGGEETLYSVYFDRISFDNRTSNEYPDVSAIGVVGKDDDKNGMFVNVSAQFEWTKPLKRDRNAADIAFNMRCLVCGGTKAI